ncbi:MAG TPA: ScpA family protein [Chloroflexia bacterium]|nr:ScpA family protein [Chloroflexia bacterium]
MNIPNTQPYAEEAVPETPDPQPPALFQTKSDTFQVQLEVFSGPLDLLLKLIERKQLDISKVALAEVAEGFLAYLQAHPDMPPGPLAAFVWVAGKLLLIKSQALLPRPPVPSADDDEEDPGDELVRRLEAYKRVQEAARWLRSREVEGLRSYVRPVPLHPLPARPRPEPEGTGLDGVTLAKLVRMVQKRMQLTLPTPVPAGAVVEGHTITVAEKMAQLRKRISGLKKGERMPLGAEFAEAATRSRTELAVLFLAVLEIIRRKYGIAEQDELFGEIWLKKSEVRNQKLEADF